jgi:peptidoglycan hydrolase-like protein with peptidoglycan-binding domain
MTVSGGWGAAVEQRIVDAYGSQFVLTGMEVQAALKKLHMYAGDVDGILGPLSRQGVFAFQRAWLLPDNGIADSRTQRVLAFVTADREMV